MFSRINIVYLMTDNQLIFRSFASGSSGNCYFLGTHKWGILIDAGISARTIQKNLREMGLDYANIMGVLVTHDHADHIRAVGTLGERVHLPIYSTRAIHDGIDRNYGVREKLRTSQRYFEKGVEWELNGMQINTVCANCFDFLRAQVKEKKKYDVIVLDPPAFTKAHANMANACRGYKEIALSAMRMLPAGGVLATHSCSYHMPEDVFVNTVLSAAQDLHRQVRVITLRRQDIDHPVLAGYPESHYLKSLWLQMLD